MNENQIEIQNPLSDPDNGIFWEYSLDNIRWQESNVFPDYYGQPFVDGQSYPVYAVLNRGQPNEYRVTGSYTFSADEKVVTLDVAAKNGRRTTKVLDAAGFEAPQFEEVSDATHFLVEDPVLEDGQVRQRIKKMKKSKLFDFPLATAAMEGDEVLISRNANGVRQFFRIPPALLGGWSGGSAIPTPPSGGVPNQALTVGQPYNYELPAWNNTQYLEVKDLPAGLNFTTATRRIWGTPTTSGNYVVTVTGVSSTGLRNSITGNFGVQAANVSRYIDELHIQRTGTSALKFTLKGEGGPEGMRLKIGTVGNGFATATFVDLVKTADKTYEYTYTSVPNGELTVRVEQKIGGGAIQVGLTLATANQAEQIYPGQVNLITNAGLFASMASGESDLSAIKNQNLEDVFQTATQNQSIVGALNLSQNGQSARYSSVVRIYTPDVASLVGAYILVGDNIAQDAGTFEINRNRPGVTAKLITGTESPLVVDVSNLRGSMIAIQAPDTRSLKIFELQATGSFPAANRPPVISTIPTIERTEGTGLAQNLNPFVTDPDGNPVSLSAVLQGGYPLPGWMSLPNGVLTVQAFPWEGGSQVTSFSYTILLTATDSLGASTTTTFTVTVKRAGTGPETLLKAKIHYDFISTQKRLAIGASVTNAGPMRVNLIGNGFTYGGSGWVNMTNASYDHFGDTNKLVNEQSGQGGFSGVLPGEYFIQFQEYENGPIVQRAITIPSENINSREIYTKGSTENPGNPGSPNPVPTPSITSITHVIDGNGKPIITAVAANVTTGIEISLVQIQGAGWSTTGYANAPLVFGNSTYQRSYNVVAPQGSYRYDVRITGTNIVQSGGFTIGATAVDYFREVDWRVIRWSNGDIEPYFNLYAQVASDNGVEWKWSDSNNWRSMTNVTPVNASPSTPVGVGLQLFAELTWNPHTPISTVVRTIQLRKPGSEQVITVQVPAGLPPYLQNDITNTPFYPIWSIPTLVKKAGYTYDVNNKSFYTFFDPNTSGKQYQMWLETEGASEGSGGSLGPTGYPADWVSMPAFTPQGGDEMWLNNGVNKLAVWRNYGSSISYLGKADSTQNYVNNPIHATTGLDYCGQQIQFSVYKGNSREPYLPAGRGLNPTYPAWPINFLQGGSFAHAQDFSSKSTILAWGKSNVNIRGVEREVLWVRCKPKEWQWEGVEHDGTFEQWIWQEGKAVFVQIETKTNGPADYNGPWDKQPQELPAMWMRGDFQQMWVGNSANPFTGDPLTPVNVFAQENKIVHSYMTEMAIISNGVHAIGVMQNDNARVQFKYQDQRLPEGTPYENGSVPACYVGIVPHMTLEKVDGFRSTYQLILGDNVEDVRNVGKNLPRPARMPRFKFNTQFNKAQSWNPYYANNKGFSSEGWHVSNWEVNSQGQEVWNDKGTSIEGPWQLFPAISVPKMYIRAKGVRASGGTSPIRLKFGKAGQSFDSINSLEGSSQYVELNFTWDGQERLYEFNMPNAIDWSGNIQRLWVMWPGNEKMDVWVQFVSHVNETGSATGQENGTNYGTGTDSGPWATGQWLDLISNYDNPRSGWPLRRRFEATGGSGVQAVPHRIKIREKNIDSTIQVLTLTPASTSGDTIRELPISGVINNPNPNPNPGTGGGLKVMMLGDSLMDDPRSRTAFGSALAAAGKTYTYVGSRGTGDSVNPRHEGNPGYTIDQIKAIATNRINTYDPDYIFLMIGTNDITSNVSTGMMSSRLAQLIDTILAAKPNVKLLVFSIPPLANSGQNDTVNAYNGQIPAVVAARKTNGRQIEYIHLNASMNSGDLASDGVHLETSGYNKMANAFMAGFNSLGQTNNPNPQPGDPNPPTPATGLARVREVFGVKHAIAWHLDDPTEALKDEVGGFFDAGGTGIKLTVYYHVKASSVGWARFKAFFDWVVNVRKKKFAVNFQMAFSRYDPLPGFVTESNSEEYTSNGGFEQAWYTPSFSQNDGYYQYKANGNTTNWNNNTPKRRLYEDMVIPAIQELRAIGPIWFLSQGRTHTGEGGYNSNVYELASAKFGGNEASERAAFKTFLYDNAGGTIEGVRNLLGNQSLTDAQLVPPTPNRSNWETFWTTLKGPGLPLAWYKFRTKRVREDQKMFEAECRAIAPGVAVGFECGTFRGAQAVVNGTTEVGSISSTADFVKANLTWADNWALGGDVGRGLNVFHQSDGDQSLWDPVLQLWRRGYGIPGQFTHSDVAAMMIQYLEANGYVGCFGDLRTFYEPVRIMRNRGYIGSDFTTIYDEDTVYWYPDGDRNQYGNGLENWKKTKTKVIIRESSWPQAA